MAGYGRCGHHVAAARGPICRITGRPTQTTSALAIASGVEGVAFRACHLGPIGEVLTGITSRLANHRRVVPTLHEAGGGHFSASDRTD